MNSGQTRRNYGTVVVSASLLAAGCVVDGSLGSNDPGSDGLDVDDAGSMSTATGGTSSSGGASASASGSGGDTPTENHGPGAGAAGHAGMGGEGGSGSAAHPEGGVGGAPHMGAGASAEHSGGAGGSRTEPAGGGTGAHVSAGGTGGAMTEPHAGGSGGAAPTPDCTLAAEDSACLACQKTSCCQELLDCHDAPLCLCLAPCLDSGATVEACVTHCGGEDDGEAQLLRTCSSHDCTEECAP